LSRYLLTIGMPFESWLQRLMDSAQRENDPDRFLTEVFERMLELSWISGGNWKSVGDVAEAGGSFGVPSRYSQQFVHRPLVLNLYTPHKMSPSLVWHFHLLSQLANEYYIAKRRARELQQMSYLRAVHETGARLTHDVKNLLQSLSNLCFVAQNAGEKDGARLTQLLQRQLPQITQRLQQTLEKLQEPQVPSLEPHHKERLMVAAELWWELLQQRYANDELDFKPVIFEPSASIPSPLFDSVVDNLLHNALIKRQSENRLLIQVALSADGTSLRVCDSGHAVRPEIAHDLLLAPVASENGLGIGLYQSAQQAEIGGYALRLADNLDGQVCFELRKMIRDENESE
jgi:hypothetical protein